MVDKETQIKILLSGDPLRFACKTLGVKDMSNNKYSEVFTVIKEDIYEYVSNNGIPQNISTSRNSLSDGFHFYEEDGRWHTCFMERGIIFDENVFDDFKIGQKHIIDTLLKLTGTGLF
jgi:hypothetical protein